MKRIAAMAALVITVLAVPATAAMASTGGPGGGGSGAGGPGARLRQAGAHPGGVPPSAPQGPFLDVPAAPPARQARAGSRRLPVHPGQAGPGQAGPALPAGGAEVRHGRREQHAHRGPGPDPGPAQELSYDGDTYTIMSVNPGADSFTVFKDGFLFVNKETAITGGTGVMCCTR